MKLKTYLLVVGLADTVAEVETLSDTLTVVKAQHYFCDTLTEVEGWTLRNKLAEVKTRAQV